MAIETIPLSRLETDSQFPRPRRPAPAIRAWAGPNHSVQDRQELLAELRGTLDCPSTKTEAETAAASRRTTGKLGNGELVICRSMRSSANRVSRRRTEAPRLLPRT